jgi:hypothetical protein
MLMQPHEHGAARCRIPDDETRSMTPVARAPHALALAAALLAAAPPAWPQAAIDCTTEMYGVTQSGTLFRVNINTAAESDISAPGATPINLADLAFDDTTGQLWAPDGAGRGGPSALRRLDPASGAQVSAVAMNPPGLMPGIAFVGGTLYGAYAAANASPSLLVTIDRTTGVLTTIGPMGVSVPISGLAYDKATATMYAVTAGSHAIAALMRVDLATGAATFVAQIGTQDKVGALQIGPDGNLYAGVAVDALVNAGWLLRVDKVTGVPTLVGNANRSLQGLAACTGAAPPPPPPPPPVTATPVPALSSFALVALSSIVALAGFVARRRRGR